MKTQAKRKRRKKPAMNRTSLPLLTAASDQSIWSALKAMRERGEVKNTLPKYSAIDAELVSQGFPALGSKQISQSIRRLVSLGYLRRFVQFAA